METEILIAGSPRSFITMDEPLVQAASVVPVLPVDQWKEVDNRDVKSPVRDQKIYQTCSGFSIVTAYDIISRRIGYTPPLLSVTYPFILGGGTAHGGMLSKVADSFQENGTCQEIYCPDYIMIANTIPKNAALNATYKPIDSSVTRLTSVEEIGTVLTKQAIVASISPVGANLDNLDQNGIIPLPDKKIGYHAWCVIGLAKLPEGITSRLPWMFLVQSSWGKNWGKGGYGFLLAEHFDALNRPITAYALWPGRYSGV